MGARAGAKSKANGHIALGDSGRTLHGMLAAPAVRRVRRLTAEGARGSLPLFKTVFENAKAKKFEIGSCTREPVPLLYFERA